MPYFGFAQFGAALCETAGVALPELAPEPDGLVAFHLIVDGVVVNVAHTGTRIGSDDDVVLLVTFGTIPEEKELEALRLIAEANYSMLGADAPVLGMNPATGEVVLRQRVTISQVDAKGVFAAILRLVALARQWQADPTLALAPHEESAAATSRFA